MWILKEKKSKTKNQNILVFDINSFIFHHWLLRTDIYKEANAIFENKIRQRHLLIPKISVSRRPFAFTSCTSMNPIAMSLSLPLSLSLKILILATCLRSIWFRVMRVEVGIGRRGNLVVVYIVSSTWAFNRTKTKTLAFYKSK